MGREGVNASPRVLPVADAVTGNARRILRQGWWWLTGNAPGVTPRAQVTVRPSSDPLDSSVAHAIRDVLSTSGVLAELTGATVGPRIIMYEIRKHKGQSVEKILRLQREFEYAVGSPSIRILSPIPGKSAIGIEVPRETFSAISLHEILSRHSGDPHPLLAAIGKDLEGRSIVANLAKMPHLLIAGATGAGKSSCLNAILLSVIQRATPEQVRMILIDPKRVEFMPYAKLPHLLMPVITDAKRSVEALGELAEEMERRYDLLEGASVRNIDEYNATRPGEPMPYILAVVDELADLMLSSKRGDSSAEDVIVRIAQKARAAGIHLVLATQRPSVDVVTGLIKANLPSRLAFAVASGDDSRTILGGHGAEKLLGQGDGLFVPAGALLPIRIQGPLVTDSEISAAVRAAQTGEWTDAPAPVATQTLDVDPLLERAKSLVVESGRGSASMLQRKLRIRFDRANQLLDRLEVDGVVGPAVKGKPRAVLARMEGAK